MDVRRDYRITVGLSWFKNRYPCNENGELESEVRITEETVSELCNIVFQSTEAELDFDGEKGRCGFRARVGVRARSTPTPRRASADHG